MRLGYAQEEFSRLLAMLLQHAYDNGYRVRMKEVYRTQEQQKLYLMTGRSKTANSKHLESLAADMYFTKDSEVLWDKEEVQYLGDYWESLDPHCTWGGNWKSFQDVPHFEYDRSKV